MQSSFTVVELFSKCRAVWLDLNRKFNSSSCLSVSGLGWSPSSTVSSPKRTTCPVPQVGHPLVLINAQLHQDQSGPLVQWSIWALIWVRSGFRIVDHTYRNKWFCCLFYDTMQCCQRRTDQSSAAGWMHLAFISCHLFRIKAGSACEGHSGIRVCTLQFRPSIHTESVITAPIYPYIKLF